MRIHERGAVVVDGVRVEFTSVTEQNRLVRTVLERAGPDGVFVLPSEEALTELVVRRSGAATARWGPSGCGSDGFRCSRQVGLTVLEIDLEPEVLLTGVAVDTFGVPVFGATLTIDGTRVRADAQGRFRVEGLAAGEHLVTVDTTDPLLVPRTRLLVQAPGDVELTVDRGGEVVVHVDLPRRGESRTVACLVKEDTPDARVVLEVAGRAGVPTRLGGLRPGRYVVEVRGPDLVPQRSAPFEVAPGVALEACFHAASRWLRARPVRSDGARVATVVSYTTAQGLDVTKHFGALVILPVPRDAVRVSVSGSGLEVLVDLAPGAADVDLGDLRLAPAS